jgi:predicted aldo/keto reductase-like oxidoreductase
MKFRNFDVGGEPVSEIGLGTWQLGADWGDLDDTTAERILDEAVDSGVTFFDTALGGPSQLAFSHCFRLIGRLVSISISNRPAQGHHT